MPDKIAWVTEIRKKDAESKNLFVQIMDLRQARNSLSKQISEAKKQGKDIAPILKKAKSIPQQIQEKEDARNVLLEEINHKLMQLPNILDKSVPIGDDEAQNKVVKKFGKKPKYTFPLKDHVTLMEDLNLVDLPRAAKISGARFWFLKNDLAKLDLALQHYAVDFMTKKGFELVNPPYMINRAAYEGVTDLADFENVMYKVEQEDLYLIATSEHPLTSMFMEEIFPPDCFPVKYCGISPCFRKEAGSHGKDTKGIFRGHQFHKVEQIIICKPEDSQKYHEKITKNAIEFFKSLGLHFKQLNMCTGDMGTVAAKKYDIEVWFPVQKKYREVASCSNCTDYQARRLKIRWRPDEKKPEEKVVPHTLNATCVATSRALAAILENFQNKDGSVTIPKVLHKYMGKKKIVPPKVAKKVVKKKSKKR